MNSVVIVLLVWVGNLVIRMFVWLFLFMKLVKVEVGENFDGGVRLMDVLGISCVGWGGLVYLRVMVVCRRSSVDCSKCLMEIGM